MNAWLPTSPCTPEACAGHEGRTASVPHAVLRLSTALLVLLAGILGAPSLRLLPAAARHTVIRAWSAALLRAFGIRITVHGGPGPRGGRLLVPNHISWLDVPLVAAAAPSRMLAKSDIRTWPLLGRLAGRAGTLFIERDRIRALPATVTEIGNALRAGDGVTVFPEGSTWCGRDRGTFRRAAFQAALDAAVPVQPVHLAYLRREGGDPAGAPAFVGDDPLTASLWRIARARGVRAEVTLLPGIPPGRHPDRRDLAAAAQRAVAACAARRAPARAVAAQPSGPSATDRDSAKRPPVSVHHWVSSSPAAASSLRTPS
ncbi:lysophospholipid acyltransferase family protein [Streptomyces sp. NPDC091201]|uniref:lysophospholipid acyltransferase family protein n=1 Tax=Streptomyces sp. NPDC091201 TaxID=3155190 RepID=UPI00342C2218